MTLPQTNFRNYPTLFPELYRIKRVELYILGSRISTMKLSTSFFALFASISSAKAGTILWSGFFNASATVADFDDCTSSAYCHYTIINTYFSKGSWSNEIGDWQWYIHGSEPTADYLALSPSYKNPADTTDSQGIKITIVSSLIETC